jgi:hypothetical protein
MTEMRRGMPFFPRSRLRGKRSFPKRADEAVYGRGKEFRNLGADVAL